MRVWALHGFLGRGSDWDFLKGEDWIREWHSLNLLTPEWTSLSLKAVGQKLYEQISAQSSPGEKPLLVAYSMGGRLALQMLALHPDCGFHAVVISAHPGLAGETEVQTQSLKEQRREADQAWARRFENPAESWQLLLKDWDAQAVLASSTSLVRKAPEQRQVLAEALRNWSLGQQENLLPPLARISPEGQQRLMWMSGEWDLKFRAQATKLKELLPASKNLVLPACGHRAPWEAPQAFLRELRHFVC